MKTDKNVSGSDSLKPLVGRGFALFSGDGFRPEPGIEGSSINFESIDDAREFAENNVKNNIGWWIIVDLSKDTIVARKVYGPSWWFGSVRSPND